MDLRYEWAVPSDQRVNNPPNSPKPDVLYLLAEDTLSNNASARPAGSLQYYVAALEENALNATSQTSVAGVLLSTRARRSLLKESDNRSCQAQAVMARAQQ